MDTSEADYPPTNGIAVANSDGENASPEPVEVEQPKNVEAMKQVARHGTSGVASDAGLRNLGQSRHMSSKQRELEMHLATSSEGTEEITNGTTYKNESRNSAREFVRCSSQDIVDQDSASSESSETQSAPTNVYELKGLPPARRMSQYGGNRIRSATGRLIDQYAKDMTVKKDTKEAAHISKPSQSIKSTRERFNSFDAQSGNNTRRMTMDREKELNEVRSTIRRRTLAGEAIVDDDGQEGEMRKRLNSASCVANDVKCTKSLGNIRDKLMTRANSQKSYKTDHSVVPKTSVNHARSFYKTIENKPEEKIKFTKPTIRRKTAEEVMANRRRSTYGKDGDDYDRHRSNSIVDTTGIDFEHIRAARAEYKRRESAVPDLTPINKPVAKKINEKEVTKTMQLHKQRSESNLQFHREPNVDIEENINNDTSNSHELDEKNNDVVSTSCSEDNVNNDADRESIKVKNECEIDQIEIVDKKVNTIHSETVDTDTNGDTEIDFVKKEMSEDQPILTNGHLNDSGVADLILINDVNDKNVNNEHDILQKKSAEVAYQEANNNNTVLDTETLPTTQFQQQEIEMI